MEENGISIHAAHSSLFSGYFCEAHLCANERKRDPLVYISCEGTMHFPYKMPTAGDIKILEDSNDSDVQSDVASSHGNSSCFMPLPVSKAGNQTSAASSVPASKTLKPQSTASPHSVDSPNTALKSPNQRLTASYHPVISSDTVSQQQTPGCPVPASKSSKPKSLASPHSVNLPDTGSSQGKPNGSRPVPVSESLNPWLMASTQSWLSAKSSGSWS